ncbi:MAG: hypothetical protein HFF75_04640 [Oscillospiraceae bacterium]|jgi:formate dehydrogenase maturation protein FdhE|nr:hypothetical protein [Oscillospiraceae bacterium]
MKDMSVNGAAAAQQAWSREQQQADAGAPVESAGLSAALSQKEEEGKDLVEMIRDAQEKAEAQREAMKLPKSSTRYGDAPLEAYARLARARSRMEVNSASGYARRRLAQFKTALRTDSDNAAKIKAAISQLQKAVNRGERKKRELDRERLTEIRRKKAAKEELKEKERRLRQELVRRRTQRMIRESGYMREAEISDRLATQLTATQMELRQQAQDLSASASASLETAVQHYTAAAESVPAAPVEAGFSGQA